MLTAKPRIPRPLRRKCVRMFRVAVSGVLEGVEFLKDDSVFHKNYEAVGLAVIRK